MGSGFSGKVCICTCILVAVFLSSSGLGLSPRESRVVRKTRSALESCQFYCDDGDCIPDSWKCDGAPDCADYSDEKESLCSSRTRRSTDDVQDNNHLLPCRPNHMRCPQEERCIPIYQFCDNTVHCPINHGDEGEFCTQSKNPCDAQNCSADCQITPTVNHPSPKCCQVVPDDSQPVQPIAKCFCSDYQKFLRTENQTKCIDHNLCDYPGFCDQQCAMVSQDYHCSCVPGYQLSTSGYCQAINEPPGTEATFLMAANTSMKQLNMNGAIGRGAVFQGKNIISVDFDHRKNTACWVALNTSSVVYEMRCANLESGNQYKAESSANFFGTIKQIAKDWVTGNWYFMDVVNHQIILCNDISYYCRSIIQTQLDIPVAMVIDPLRGYLFYAVFDDITSRSSIRRTSLDGSDNTVIDDGRMSMLHKVMGLTLDYANEHLYILEQDVIHRRNYNGTRQYLIFTRLQASTLLSSPKKEAYLFTSITMFENHLYVTTNGDPHHLIRIHRYDYSFAEKITDFPMMPQQIHVYHRQRQPGLPGGVSDPCASSGCNQLCVLNVTGDSVSAKCLCAAGYKMNTTTNKCFANKECKGGHDPDCIVSEGCEDDQVRCPGGLCIPKGWWCDGQEDCSNNGDEAYCDGNTCSLLQFSCDQGHCIDQDFVCDGSKDCPDGSDEEGCPSFCDPNTEFLCEEDGKCLSVIFRCDGVTDCQNGTDELNCRDYTGQPNLCMAATEFQCDDGECVSIRYRCDGDSDCIDDSDEKNCKNVTLHCDPFTEWKCATGNKCIALAWKCDKEPDCHDHSDEENCEVHCDSPDYKCKGDNSQEKCVTPLDLCNGKNDCPQGDDEGGQCGNATLCDNSGCTNCTQAPWGPLCICPPGMKLAQDQKTCEVTNSSICSQWGICGQNCVEDKTADNGYHCSCSQGFFLEKDGYTCKPESESVYIIFSNRHEMRRVDLNNFNYASLVSGLRNTIALDFFYDESWIFWTDVVDDKIFRGKILSNSFTQIEPIIDVGLATTEGLAVDWIGQNIYWVESNLDQIEVAKLDGSNRTTLIAGNMISPRAIVLDPREGALFWTDWDSKYPRIETCSMAGENRRTIFNISAIVGGGWPNGLTIDYDFKRLYWIDARSDSIHTIDYSGHDHRLILKHHSGMRHPFALTLFGNYVYWTDWGSNSLMRANKFFGTNVTTIQQTMTQPFDLQVYHPMRQPKIPNPCDQNGGCSHLCLIGYKQTAKCLCPHLKKLSEDGKTCVADNKFLLFVRSNIIRGVDLSNANFSVIPTITVPHVDRPTAVDYDSKAGKLYWADRNLNVINSANNDGSSVETIIDSGISNPEGFAIDWMSGNMYFSSFANGGNKASISVAKLNGAYRAEVISTGLTKPNSLVVFPSEGLMFWSDVGNTSNQATIYRSKMDGTEITPIIHDLTMPASLKLDSQSKMLYWVNRGNNNSVMSCDINGKSCHVIKNDMITKPLALTLAPDGIMYVASNDAIYSMNKNGSNVKLLRDKTPEIEAMQVYDLDMQKGSNLCSQDNGGCSQLCLPIGPDAKVCKCTAGFKLTNQTACTGIESFLIYSTPTEIHGIQFDPNELSEALPLISKISMAKSVDFIAYDKSKKQDHIYWMDSKSQRISRIGRDLMERETIVDDDIGSITDIAVDWVAENLYWVDEGHNIIEVASLNRNRSRYVIVHGEQEKPKEVVVDPVNGFIYWINSAGMYTSIKQARMDGTNRTKLVTTNQAPKHLILDHQSNDLYYWSESGRTFHKFDIDRSQLTTLNISKVETCLALTIYNNNLYWAQLEKQKNSSIRFSDKNGNGVVHTLRDNLKDKVTDIKAFDHSLQPKAGNNPCMAELHGDCQQLCFYKGGTRKQCACSYSKLSEDGLTCEENDVYLLYSKVTSIESTYLNENNPQRPLKKIENAGHIKNVIGLAVDIQNQRLFFSDIQRGDIQFVSFTGDDFTVVVDAVGSAEGLAYMLYNDKSYLYYTSYTNSSICRVMLYENGTRRGEVEKVVQLGVNDHPRAIVLDTCSDQMFWTNWNDLAPKIQRSTLNGYDVVSIITEDIRTPNGLAIDHKAQRLYWSDARLDKIERSDFSGNHREVILTTIPQHSFGLTVYGDFVYWTDWMLRAVVRVNKYDDNIHSKLRHMLDRQPMGLVIYAKDAEECADNPCYMNAFGCSDQCFVNEKGQAYCNCTNSDMVLLPDGKTCVTKDTQCSKTDFVCHDKLQCIPSWKVCNNITDCLDGSDELESVCKRTPCATGFQCNNFKCIPKHEVCDGENQCGDLSDEGNCTCNPDTEFRCHNGACIQKNFRCDRDKDCADFSDEIGCGLDCNIQAFQSTKEEVVPCNTTSQCILQSWICDGVMDCWDNVDEKNCPNKTSDCPEGKFQCASGSCIPITWHCDTDDDCGDKSDEKHCANETCPTEMFECKDGTCLPKSWECDGHPDCPDHSDESKGCLQPNRTCKDDEFQCKNGRCIIKAWKCDGDSDCSEGEDEKDGCEAIVCDAKEFRCNNTNCIRDIFFCDKDDDCGDMSDEPSSCYYNKCKDKGVFDCGDNTCINDTLRCNGFPDCRNKKDEENCPIVKPRMCNGTDFLCKNGDCINDNLVCNGRNDCGDSSDETEQCFINECLFPHLMCSHRCVDQKIGYRCECPPGYQLKDNHICEDIDECESYPCSHFCVNGHGHYKCYCYEGFYLERDNRTCKVMNDMFRPSLIVANRHQILNMTFDGHYQSVIVSGTENAVAVDYDFLENTIYWTDITSTSSWIRRLDLRSKDSKPQTLHDVTVKNPDGLAVDWLGRNLYWCDKTADTIEVSRLDGTFRKVLIHEGLQEPRGLEVHPLRGYLFYTDWGEHPHISRAFMDGSNIEKIITDNLAWPNGLTIDYVTEKIFWSDASLDYISMADLDGKNQRVVINSHLPHTFALTTFEGYIFWTDWDSKTINRANKFTGEDRKVIVKTSHRPMDIQVYHMLRQVEGHLGNNPCRVNNGGCSHLCLLKPFVVLSYRMESYFQSTTKVCACPENYELSGGFQCVSACNGPFHFECKESFKCIPSWWRCDNHTDCANDEDERDCDDKPYFCKQRGYFQCGNATDAAGCVPPVDICNGRNDCSDGTDEMNCDQYQCMKGYIKCMTGNKCIPESHRCDGTHHCEDKSDEFNCTAKDCKPDQFKCDSVKCVPLMWRCDKDKDCMDGTDEPDSATCKASICPEHFFKCQEGRCIPDTWKCDGDPDCGITDQSDEWKCDNVSCSTDQFQCVKNKNCIPKGWRCDHDFDCKDGSDEDSCEYPECTPDQFRCNNDKCIPLSWKCNDEINCEDGSDEGKCGNKTSCSEDEFKCNTMCIPKAWHCDTDIDCTGGEDERDCNHAIHCPSGQFKCDNGTCIPELWRCDGELDCVDKTDEQECDTFLCPADRFQCRNGRCILSNRRCDGVNQCGDNSDEENCYIDHVCTGNSFRCNSTSCIPMHQVCNGKYECGLDHSDENPFICNNSKECDLGQTMMTECEQKCIALPNTPVGYKCGCKEGFTLKEDGYGCEVQDLCKKWGTCTQLCQFKRNQELESYVQCSCDEGYRRAFMVDGSISCKADGPTPRILVARETVIIQSDVFGKGESPVTKDVSEKISSIDVDMTTDNKLTMFVVSHSQHSIIKTTLQGSGGKSSKVKRASPNKVLIDHLGDPRGIAVNWVGKHIYWTDLLTRKIEMANYEGQQRRTVVSAGVDQPFSIVVHPEIGKLYWTDRGFTPRIESANLDGSGRKDIVKDNIVWPNGLAIDYPNGRLYWADTKKHTIETVDLQGKDRHIVMEMANQSPYKIDIFEDYLYVSFYKFHGIKKIHKFNANRLEAANNSRNIFPTRQAIRDVLILQPSKQKSNIHNYCNATDYQCPAAMCINMPQRKSKPYTCVCPDGATYYDERCDFSNCNPGYCLNGGTCNMSSSGPKCSCPPGYNGTKCDNYVCNDYCKNEGFCMVYKGSPVCRCPEVYSGDRCEKKQPVNQVCIGYCENDGVCTMNGLIRKCKCKEGFTGTRCEQCTLLTCYNGGTCHVISNSTPTICYGPSCSAPSTVTCRCRPGFDPTTQCSFTSCKYLNCSANQKCVKQHDGTLKCVCKEGFSGENCDKATSLDCGCLNGGTCQKKANSIENECLCPEHYRGAQCQTAITECAGFCQNGATCHLDQESHPKCTCPPIFSGIRCDQCLCGDYGKCDSSPSGSNTHCICTTPLYTGQFCNTSACSNYCYNDGTCGRCVEDKTTGKFGCKECRCTNGFIGERCETPPSHAHIQAQTGSNQVVTIAVPVVISVVLIIVIILVVVLICRRRDQFKHQRMHNSNMEINNPIYSPRQHRDDAEEPESEVEPLDMEDHNTNFANPMYARLYTTDSTQVLLPKETDSDEALDKNGDLNFYSSKANPKKSNF